MGSSAAELDISTEEVHVSYNYDEFKVFEFNRDLITPLVDEIVESIRENGYLPGKAIQVTKKKEIIDGQHRFEACVRTGEPIRYVFLPPGIDPLKLIIDVNANQRAWTLINFVNAWAKSGKKCYQELLQFEEQHKLTISNSITIFMGTGDNTNKTTNIKSGKEFKPYPRSTEVAWFISECSDFVPYAKTSKFVTASLSLYKNATDKQIVKIKKAVVSIPQMANASDYVTAFENIINKGQKKENYVSLRSKK